MAKVTVRAMTNMGWNPEFYPDKQGLWAKAGDVVEVPEFYQDRPDLVDIWVKLGAVEIVQPPAVYKPKTQDKKDGE